MRITRFVQIFILLAGLSLINEASAQKYVFSHGGNLEAWYSCDTSLVEFNLDKSGLLQAKVQTNEWGCLGISFQELNITEYTSLEIVLKVDSGVPLTYASFMFKFKDTSGYMSVDPKENIYPIDTSGVFTKIFIRLDDEENQLNFINNNESVFDPIVTNSIIMYFRFETEVPDQKSANVVIDSIRFY